MAQSSMPGSQIPSPQLQSGQASLSPASQAAS
jgi:hypothetical protein